MKYLLGVDLGGTTTKIGLFTDQGELIEKRDILTRVFLGRDAVFKDITGCIEEMIEVHGVDLSDCTAGLGVPGPIDENGYADVVVNLNMSDFYPGKALSDLLGGMPVKAANDANAAALGEVWQGGGRGYRSSMFVTLGTGVGGGVVIGERILHGAHGLGGEIGHIWVNPDEPELCNCGGHGCLDQMASATGIVRNARRMLLQSNEKSLLRDAQDMTAKDVLDAAKQGDAIAGCAVDYCMGFLGKTLADVSHVADPEVFVIGGGLSLAGPYLVDVIAGHYRKYPRLKPNPAKFALAQLGTDAGMYGAARLALDLMY